MNAIGQQLVVGWLCAALLAAGCLEHGESARSSAEAQDACPARVPAPALLPGTKPEHLRPEYWLSQYTDAQLDTPLMSPDEVRAYNAAVGRRPGNDEFSQRNLLIPPSPSALERELRRRLSHLRDQIEAGRYLDRHGRPPAGLALEIPSTAWSDLGSELRVAVESVAVRCSPYADSLYADDGIFDRNACSTIRPQEVVQLLTRWSNGMHLVRTRYTVGWIRSDALLSPPIPGQLEEFFVLGPRSYAKRALELIAEDGSRHRLPAHASVPIEEAAGSVMVASTLGFHRASPPEAVFPSPRVFTRRALLETAFGFLHASYGLGGQDGGIDCSRLQLDLFETFGLALPRYSGAQARAGTFSIEVAHADAREKLHLLDEASRRGAVLLHLPGHVMLYLSRNAEGLPMALHALGEYAQPCSTSEGETLVDVRRVVVSDLELGGGSSRGSLLERLTVLVVIGRDSGPSLGAVARRPVPPPRPPSSAEACEEGNARFFVSPRRPAAGRPFRIVASTDEDGERARLWLFNPDGDLAESIRRRSGGPPFLLWTGFDQPSPGRWTALLESGAETLGCRRVQVLVRGPASAADRADDPT